VNPQAYRYSPAILAVLSGLLQIVIFPSLELSWLGFICFVPLLVLVSTHRSRALFLYFGLGGIVFQLGNLYWIFHVIEHYTKLPVLLAAGVLLLLCLAISVLFWGTFGALLGLFHARLGMYWAMLAAPFLWITLEWLRNHGTQFPWCFLGYSQYNHIRLAQFAALTGVYGLSWLLLAANASITILITLKRSIYFILITVLVLCIYYYGNNTINNNIQGERITVGCVQGNVPQDVKLSYQFAEEINRRQLQMTDQLIRTSKPDLVLWSESSTLFPLREGGPWTAEIQDLARTSGTPFVIGSDSFDREGVYNSAFLVNSRGEIDGRYDKVYLVPFGEYVPLRSILFFAGKVVPEISDFSAGKGYHLFPIKGGKFAVHICFEVVFPQLTREFCLGDASLLVNITNDAWFGDTSAPRQHFAMAVMRAIENRRYMVRAANTGISGIIDPYGRILQTTKIFVPALVSGEVKNIRELTFYTRYGDLLVYAAILIVSFAFIVAIFRRPRSTHVDARN